MTDAQPTDREPDSMVFGAGGFIGRALTAELLRQGRHVAAAVRRDPARFRERLAESGTDTGRLTVVTADITRPGLALDRGRLRGVRDVYNAAARFAFGLTAAEAKAVNLHGALHVLDWAADRERLRRLVHISGYRVSAGNGRSPDYRRLGAYEASKLEADSAVRARAADRGIPLSVANPSTVIGPGQYLGLATLVADLWRGRLPLVPGSAGTFLPVVGLDHFVRFLAALPEHPGSTGESYWILDDRTPPLPELIRLLADHLGVRAPRGTLPTGLVRALPRALTGADPETLSFLATDRYPTASAREFAAEAGITAPSVREELTRWADGLVAADFGDAPTAPDWTAGFRQIGGSRTWTGGDRERPAYVLLHGLPLDADSWAQTARELPGSVLVADLPGLGRSSPTTEPRERWLAELLRPVRGRPVLVAHSAACLPALRYAAAHPDRIAALVLVAAPFLGRPASRWSRLPGAAALLRRTSADGLARRLGVPPGPATRSAAAQLRRPHVARRTLAALRADTAGREEAAELLRDLALPVRCVSGARDLPAVPMPGPEGPDGPVPTDVIAEAGHYPQLTHPGQLAALLRDAAGKPPEPRPARHPHRTP